jgi:hypothetical protein
MLIARRVLALRSVGRIIDVPIEIFLPEQVSGGMWRCRYAVQWPDATWSHAAQGVDGVQALSLALEMIGAVLYASDYHKSGNLYFEVPGKGYGFPVAKSLRDLLVGDDAMFD